ncbi:MAG TPA: BamA/TamA family outer membrane protein, partial [Malonomonas sp.]
QEILNVAADASTFIKEEAGSKTLSSITGEIVRNTTDYHQDPSSGGMSRFSLEYAGLGGTENFVKTKIGHRHFFPLFWGTVFSPNAEIGYVTSTNGDQVSIGERFFLGGIRTLRGFKSREVGPQDSASGDYRGGEKMAYFNFEYLFPIYKSLGIKGLLFYDTGNAWLDSETYFSDMRNSVGAGIRWLSPLGPLRFEWGYNLSPRDDEKQSVFEFSIGTVF